VRARGGRVGGIDVGLDIWLDRLGYEPACDTCHTLPEDVRRAHGCIGTAPAPVWFDSKNRPHYRCPQREVSRTVILLLDMYERQSCGILPAAGGLLDQTPQVLQAFRYIRAERAAHMRRTGKGKG